MPAKAKIKRRWTPAELRKMPPRTRDRILRTAATLAEREYRSNSELTAFQAFGDKDLYGSSSDSQTR